MIKNKLKDFLDKNMKNKMIKLLVKQVKEVFYQKMVYNKYSEKRNIPK